MLPNNSISDYTGDSPIHSPDIQRTNQFVDHEEGGVGIEDASQGLTGYNWSCFFDGQNVYAQRSGEAATVLYAQSGIQEIAFAFDQNMRPSTLAVLSGGDMELRWYNSLISAYTNTNLGQGAQVQMTLDDKRPSQRQNSDIVIAYRRGDTVYYRIQRDRYENEYVASFGLDSTIKLRNLAMSRNLRLQFVIS